jgi:ankyrin repeat protein
VHDTVVSQNGWAPLVYAVVEGHLEVASFLLERGADITAQEDEVDYSLPILLTLILTV